MLQRLCSILDKYYTYILLCIYYIINHEPFERSNSLENAVMPRKQRPTSPADIIRAARLCRGQTQAQFAAEIGRSQAEVSRYESGQVDPPSQVLMLCLADAGFVSEHMDVSVKQLTDRIRQELRPKSKNKVRTAVWQLLDLARSG